MLDQTLTLNKIATIAGHSRKPNKRYVFDMICDAVRENRQFDEREIANLYAYFIPAAPKNKTNFQWVHSAVSKNATQYYLHYVYVEDGQMVATDGHRLHFAPTSLENGFYDAAQNKVDADVTFPDWKRVVPERNGVGYTLFVDKLELFHKSENGKAICGYSLPNASAANKQYIDAALCGQKEARCYQDLNTDPIRIELDNGRVAVVMPLRQ